MALLLGLALPAAVADRPASAQTSGAGGAASSDGPSQEREAPDSVADGLGPPLGGPGGWRNFLRDRGVDLELAYIGEALHNARGGIRRGSIGEGRLEAALELDLEKLLDVADLGITFNASAFQIHGRGLSRSYLGNLLPASGIEALPSTRLFELWFEKSFGERASLRAGQLAADTEFLISDTAALFVNGTFGWPGITGANLPGGGPAYPFATPGVRFEAKPADGVTLLGAVLNGDPAGPGPGDPQRNNRSGTEFRARDPAFLIGELQYAYHQDAVAVGLPGTVKLGAWHHAGRFDDQRFDPDGRSLADPDSSGLARRLRSNRGLYGVVDQAVYRRPGSGSGEQRGIDIFARLSGSPSDRNPISVYADAGIAFKGLLDSRPRDTFGIGFGYAQVSSRARGLDRDARRFGSADGIDPETGAYTGPAMPVRSSEAVIEVTYQAEITRGWTVQPDVQYVIRPGGNVANPRDPNGAPAKNAAIFGLRTTIRY